MDNAAEAAPIEEQQQVEQAAEPVENQVEAAPEAEAPERPEWLPEKFKTPEDMAKSYTELEKKLGAPKEEAPEEYALNLPEQYADMELDDDELVSGFLEVAKTEGMPQEAVDKMVAMYAEWAGQIEAEEAQRQKTEVEALGKNAKARLQDLNDWGAANLSQEAYQTLAAKLDDAAGVALFEEIKGLLKEPGLPVKERATTDHDAEAQRLKAMQFEKDENGNRRLSTDAAFRRQFRELQAKIHGNQPAQEIIR